MEIAKSGGRGKITILDMPASQIWPAYHAPILRSPLSVTFVNNIFILVLLCTVKRSSLSLILEKIANF